MLSPRSLRNDIVAFLDIGSSKITCVIAHRRVDPGVNGSRVIGFGQRQAEGVRAGMIIDLDQAERAVRGAIGDAETAARITVENVHVAFSSGRLNSTHFTAHLNLEAERIRPDDLKHLEICAHQYAERSGRTLIHLNRIHYALDGETGIRDPKNMLGKRLSCQFHAVTGDPAPLNNLECLIERCYLGVRRIVPTGFASAVAATTPDEQRIGVTCIDIGAGTAQIAVIVDSRLIYTDTLAIGGATLTHDIARALSISLAEAERIKTLYGSVLYPDREIYADRPYWDSAADQLVNYRALQGEQQETTVADLSGILYPRARRQIEFVKERLARSSLAQRFVHSIVLTGGGSQLNGLCGLAAEVLQCPVRIGAPPKLQGLASEYNGPALSTVAGLQVVDAAPEQIMYSDSVKKRTDESYMRRMEQWLRESF